MVLKRPVTVARKGRILGEFSSGDLPALIQSGEILPDDNCYLEETNEWQPVRIHIEATETPKARAAMEEFVDPEERISGPVMVLQLRGVAMLVFTGLLVLALFVAAGVWIATLSRQLAESTMRVADLQVQLFNLPASGDEFDPRPKIPKSRSKVVGQAFRMDEYGGKQLLTGFFIDLYEEKPLREYLESRSLDLAAFKQTMDQEILGRVLRDLPPPIRKTTTNANGLYEFELPAEGRYVIYSSTTQDGLFGPEIQLWLLSFDTADPLNLPVNITDDTRSTRYEPEFLIRLGRPDSSTIR
jgi:hypothetical protein